MGLLKQLFTKKAQPVLPTLREGAPLTATPPVVSLDASNSRPQPSGALSPGPDVAPPVAPPVEYGAVDYSHEEDTEIMLDKLELGEVPHAIPDSCAAGHAAPSDGGPAASPPVDSGDGASDGSPQASPSSSGQVGLGCEAHGGQNPPHAGGEGVEALGPVPLSSMVYLTEDAEDIDDSVSVVSDVFTEKELVGELDQLNRALEALESEAPSSPPAPSGPLGSSPSGSFSNASIGAPEQFTKNMVKLYNDLAVRLMDAKDYTQALTMLRKAEALLDNDAAWVPAPNGMEPGSSDGALGMGDRNASSSTGALSAFLAADSSVDEVASGYLSTAGYSASGPGGVLAAKRNHLRAITYNNIGCLYKRQARPQDALAYLQNALALEESAGNVRDCASTHLNLCAAYSALDRFKEALSHAEHAIVLLQRQLWGPTATSFQDGAAHLARLLGTLGAADSPPDAKHRARRLVASANVLAMAYHNAAVEHERLGRMREAQVSYSRACTLGTRFLGAKSATTVALNKAHKGFQVRQARQTAGPGHHASGGGATGSSVKKGPSTIASRGMSTTTKIRQTAAPKRASVLGGSSTRAAGAARAKPSATSSLLSTRTSSAMDRAGSKSSVAGRDRR